jgi:hypothetical protein
VLADIAGMLNATIVVGIIAFMGHGNVKMQRRAFVRDSLFCLILVACVFAICYDMHV